LRPGNRPRPEHAHSRFHDVPHPLPRCNPCHPPIMNEPFTYCKMQESGVTPVQWVAALAERDAWDVLEAGRSEGVEAAKRAWRELVALYHPDHHADMPPGVQARAAARMRRVQDGRASFGGGAGGQGDD